jgi:glycolate oxidase
MGSIADELTSILGPGKVLRDEAALAVYAVDQAPVVDYRLPAAVILAETVDDVQATVKACAARNVPLVPRGAGTGVSGGCPCQRRLRRPWPGTDEPHSGAQRG